MAFFFIFAGLLALVSAVRGTHAQLGALLKSDFTGPGNFIYWTAVVLVIGSIGYLKPFRTLSRAFLVLIIIILLLTKGNPNLPGGGFFAQLLSGLGSTAKAAIPNTVTQGVQLLPVSQSAASSSGAPAAAPAPAETNGLPALPSLTGLTEV